ncbi:hypothetical protein O181_131716 [Austropuccinia psidii MF-1]|uniref:Uncharacterized protein n=1 Tax=Austropuccinia psidii MF-1 TaxID=1389203 RepID=A0A9Q3L575_9BASI|nr:hypothetical protein [Austropuccinia psidii MF-1]
MPSIRSGASYNPSSSSQKGYRHDYGRSQSVTEGQGSGDDFQINTLCNSEADNTVLPSNRADTTTRSLSQHLQSQTQGLQQCTAAQRVPVPCGSVEKLHKLLPEKEHDVLNRRMEESQPSTTQASAKNSPSSQQQQFQCEKAATSSEQGQRKCTSHNALQTGLHDPKTQQDAMENVFQMARTMMELQKKEEARFKYQK